MWHPFKAFLSGGILSFLVFGPVYGQAGWVELRTNHADALVYADSVWLGTAENSIFLVPADARRLILVPNSIDSWSIPSIGTSLSGGRTDTLRVELNFPVYYRLESIPSGVDVYLSAEGVRTLLGSTPLDYSSGHPLDGEFVFDRAGFVTRTVPPGVDLWNRHLVLLESVDQMDPVLTSGITGARKSTRWLDYVAAGTSLVGGLLAIHYKTKADRLYDEFTDSRDLRLKSDIDRFDLYSGIALGAMQVGLGVLAFRLIF